MLEAAAFEIRLEFFLHVVRQRPASGFARGDELGKVPLDERVEQRRLGPVAEIPRRIDERWRARACPLGGNDLASFQRRVEAKNVPHAGFGGLVTNLGGSNGFTFPSPDFSPPAHQAVMAGT